MLRYVLAASLLAATSTLGYTQAQNTRANQPTKRAAGNRPSTASSAMSKPTSERQRNSYAIGVDIARNIKSQNLQLDVDMLAQAMRDVLDGRTLAMTDQEMQQAYESIQKTVQEQSQKSNSALSDKNSKEGQEFLAQNARKQGVRTTQSGLQYEVIREGSGPRPSDTSTVTVHYHGTLISGEVFDSSVERGQPATFPVNGVIPGWQEALPLMNQGSKYRLYIPSELAYGTRGAGAKIGPNAVLIFDVELLSIAGR